MRFSLWNIYSYLKEMIVKYGIQGIPELNIKSRWMIVLVIPIMKKI